MIVNMASIAGLIGFANTPIYVASKHAVLGMTKAVALEFRPCFSLMSRLLARLTGSILQGW